MSFRIHSLLLILLSLTALNLAQIVEEEVIVSPDPPYICQIGLKETSTTTTQIRDVTGNIANSFEEPVQYLRSEFCSCLGLVFSQDNYQGRIATFKFGGNRNWWRIPYLARSLVVTCGPGISNTYFTTR